MNATSSISTLTMSPSIDAAEARRTAEELANMVRKLGPDSLVGMVLRQAMRELKSLEQSARNESVVVGPYRVAA